MELNKRLTTALRLHQSDKYSYINMVDLTNKNQVDGYLLNSSLYNSGLLLNNVQSISYLNENISLVSNSSRENFISHDLSKFLLLMYLGLMMIRQYHIITPYTCQKIVRMELLMWKIHQLLFQIWMKLMLLN